MAEGNRETFGPRVGLPSHGAPAKGGPRSKYLARVKISQTSAGPPSLTISDLSAFPSCPAFPSPTPGYPLWSSSIVARLVGLRRSLVRNKAWGSLPSHPGTSHEAYPLPRNLL